MKGCSMQREHPFFLRICIQAYTFRQPLVCSSAYVHIRLYRKLQGFLGLHLDYKFVSIEINSKRATEVGLRELIIYNYDKGNLQGYTKEFG